MIRLLIILSIVLSGFLIGVIVTYNMFVNQRILKKVEENSVELEKIQKAIELLETYEKSEEKEYIKQVLYARRQELIKI